MTAVTTTSSSISEKRAANALGGKTARACDSCLGRRARWYCAADDAFLCQSCDSSVHSANPLARRHERVRLKTSSLKASDNGLQLSLPPWNHGFCQKARTPRHAKSAAILQRKVEPMQNPLLVPEIHDDVPLEDNEEQLLYRVPIFDPMVSEFCNSSSEPVSFKEDVEISPKPSIYHSSNDGLLGFIPSEIDLAEFAADVESLLGRGIDEGSFYMEELLDPKEEDHMVTCFEPRRVKLEQEEDATAEGCNVEVELDLSRETLDLNFDCDSQTTTEEVEEKLTVSTEGNESLDKRKGSFLRLDYEAVIAAWVGSPWTTAERPKFNPDEYWPDFTGVSASEIHAYGDMASVGAQVAVTDGGREARVSRYREKRRTRLFSKKIRYEVRKLNAEKRPRMKGRFVKRSSFVSPLPY